MRFLLSVAVLTAVSIRPAVAQSDGLQLQSAEVVPGLYAISSADERFIGGTIALISGEDGQILIDGGISEVSGALLAEIESLVGDAVDFVVNTHVHGDHTGSNAALHNTGATVLAHDNIRSRMLADGAAAEALPQLTYDDGVTLHLNGLTMQVIHVANAHTDGDSIVYFPDVNVIHAGDLLFNGLFPYIDLANGGSTDGYLLAMSKIIAIADNDTRIIAGHGPVIASRSDVQAAQDVIVASRGFVKALKDQGMSEDEVVAANPLAPYHDEWNWDFITTEVMTRQMYQSL